MSTKLTLGILEEGVPGAPEDGVPEEPGSQVTQEGSGVPGTEGSGVPGTQGGSGVPGTQEIQRVRLPGIWPTLVQRFIYKVYVHVLVPEGVPGAGRMVPGYLVYPRGDKLGKTVLIMLKDSGGRYSATVVMVPPDDVVVTRVLVHGGHQIDDALREKLKGVVVDQMTFYR